MNYTNGNKTWYFPDGELPPPGDEPLKGHESVIILNDNDTPASIRLTVFFTDRDPWEDIKICVMAKRVLCIRMDNPDQLEGRVIPREVQYAIKFESDVPVVMQYGRLDTRQLKMAFYASGGHGY